MKMGRRVRNEGRTARLRLLACRRLDVMSMRLNWLIGISIIVVLFALPTAAHAQTPDNGAPQPAVDSPLLPPTPTPSPTLLPTPSPTPTETPSPAPAATPTPDLSAAVLQVSPLGVAPDDRTITGSSALTWITLAVLIVLAGAVVMTVAQRRE